LPHPLFLRVAQRTLAAKRLPGVFEALDPRREGDGEVLHQPMQAHERRAPTRRSRVVRFFRESERRLAVGEEELLAEREAGFRASVALDFGNIRGKVEAEEASRAQVGLGGGGQTRQDVFQEFAWRSLEPNAEMEVGVFVAQEKPALDRAA